MTNRFTATRYFGTAISGPPANDGASSETTADGLLRDALMHFARHGLGAADLARDHAEKAFFANDQAGYDRWIGICRLLDARMARAVAAREAGARPNWREA